MEDKTSWPTATSRFVHMPPWDDDDKDKHKANKNSNIASTNNACRHRAQGASLINCGYHLKLKNCIVYGRGNLKPRKTGVYQYTFYIEPNVVSLPTPTATTWPPQRQQKSGILDVRAPREFKWKCQVSKQTATITKH